MEECDHDYEWVDASFDHEFGTEQCGFWLCQICEHVDNEMEPPSYDDWDIDLAN